MRVTVLNGNPSAAGAGFDAYLRDLEMALGRDGHATRVLTLRDMKIKPCAGCFGCWVKTPGACVAKDDSAEVCRAIVHADLLVFASPVLMGFTSALLKKAHEKMIPVILPYLRFYHKECHHPQRYPSVPRLGLLLGPEADSDAEDLEIIEAIYRRNAINFHSGFAFAETTAMPPAELARKISLLNGTPIVKDVPPAPDVVRQWRREPEALAGGAPKRLAVFNGSPRGAHSTSAILLEAFGGGFTSVDGNSCTRNSLMAGGQEELCRAFTEADAVMLAFPMYCDTVPYGVKTFLEALGDLRGRAAGKAMGYIVHYGFPEAVQGRAVERYLAKLTRRLGAVYLGTVVRGHTEGTRDLPPEKTKGLRDAFAALGRSLAEQGALDRAGVAALAVPETLPAPVRGLFRLLSWPGLVDAGWNKMLKGNGVYAERFARPYLER